MAAPITTATQIEAPINVQFQRMVLATSKPMCPYFAGTSAASVERNGGSFTAKWRRYDNISPFTTPLTALSGNVAFPTRDSIQPTISNVSATVGKYGTYFVLNEEVDLINFNAQSAALAEVLGIGAGRTLNQLQRNEEEDNSTALLGSGAAAVNAIVTAITKNDLKNAGNHLKRNNAMPFFAMTTGSQNENTSPVRQSFYLITHPDVEEDIRDLDGFIPVESYGSQTSTEEGEFGAIGDFRCMVSSDASIDTNVGGTASGTGLRTADSLVDVYNTVVYGKNAFGSVGLGFEHVKEVYRSGDSLPGVQVIRHERGSSGAADPLNELATLGVKTWHAAAVLSEKVSTTTSWCRNIKTGASALT